MPTRMVVHLHYVQNKQKVGHDVFEGEVPMSQEEQDAYRQLKGDEKASVTASKELSEADYGNGGKVFVSVTLTVDQSEAGISRGIDWAKHMVDKKAWESHAELKQQLVSRGILR